MNDVLSRAREGVAALDGLLDEATAQFRRAIAGDGAPGASVLNDHQYAAHSLAWIATYVEALRQLTRWAGDLEDDGRFGEAERLILRIAFGEYTAQIFGGIPMAQGEFARLTCLLPQVDVRSAHLRGALADWERLGNDQASRSRLLELMLERSGSPSYRRHRA